MVGARPARRRCGCRPSARRAAVRAADAPQRGDGPVAHRRRSTSRRVSRATPPGLANPVAVFACSFVSPIPTAHVSPVAASTAALHVAGRSASGSSVRTPTNASSQPHTSTTTGNDRSVAITRPTPRRRPGGPTAGTRRRGTCGAAAASGMPDVTPNARASYDAVATTCRGRFGLPSPPTTTGRPAQLGPAQDLDRGQELVEVDVQDPVDRQSSLRATAFGVTFTFGSYSATLDDAALAGERGAQLVAARRARPVEALVAVAAAAGADDVHAGEPSDCAAGSISTSEPTGTNPQARNARNDAALPGATWAQQRSPGRRRARPAPINRRPWPPPARRVEQLDGQLAPTDEARARARRARRRRRTPRRRGGGAPPGGRGGARRDRRAVPTVGPGRAVATSTTSRLPTCPSGPASQRSTSGCDAPP